jgi:uncharacterized membrane protein YjdF
MVRCGVHHSKGAPIKFDGEYTFKGVPTISSAGSTLSKAFPFYKFGGEYTFKGVPIIWFGVEYTIQKALQQVRWGVHFKRRSHYHIHFILSFS